MPAAMSALCASCDVCSACQSVGVFTPSDRTVGGYIDESPTKSSADLSG